jgi:hypothetical protein
VPAAEVAEVVVAAEGEAVVAEEAVAAVMAEVAVAAQAPEPINSQVFRRSTRRLSRQPESLDLR